MKKSCMVFLFALLLVMPFVVANTEVKIKTVPLAEVQIGAYITNMEFNSDSRIGSHTGNTDVYGDIKYDFEITEDEFNLMVFVKREREDTIMKKFSNNPSGELVYLEVVPKNFELIATPGFENGVSIVEEIEGIINDTEENETESVEDENSMAVKTGFSVFGEKGILSKKNFFYLGGFLLLIVIVGFVVASIKHKRNENPKEIKIKKLSELQKEKEENLDEKEENIEDYKKIVEDAERKIAEAQADIKKIKNEGKIKEMKKKIAEDEAELIKLREGKD